MATPTARPASGGVRRVNDMIWESLDNGGHDEPVPFFCECADDNCYRPVWLRPAEYERCRLEAGWMALAADHLIAPAAE